MLQSNRATDRCRRSGEALRSATRASHTEAPMRAHPIAGTIAVALVVVLVLLVAGPYVR